MTLVYFIKCFISMGIAWSIYKLVLADKKSFLFNRGFLLISIVGLALVPFLSLPSSLAPVVEPMVPQLENIVTFTIDLNQADPETLSETGTSITPEVVSKTTAFNWMWMFYIVGFVLLLRIIYNMTKLSVAAFRNHSHSENKIRIIDSNYKNTPFSFFSNLFLSSGQMEEGLPKEVLAHELCHINHYHSIDRIVVELILLIQWWNPFAHLLIRSLKENHEFTADDYALRSKGTSNELIDQILSYSTRSNSNQLFQIGFAQHSIVKRIKMIKRISIVTSPFMAIILTFIMAIVIISCTDSIIENHDIERDVEIVNVVDKYTNLEYRYPKSLVDKVQDSGRLKGFAEYRSPNKELFEKFVTDPTFELYLNGERMERKEYKTLKYNSIKSFNVSDISHMDLNVDYRAYLYTQDGYFEMMNASISGMNEFMKKMAKKSLNLDLLWKSVDKYHISGGAPESEIPKPKIISAGLFQQLRDPSKYRIKIDNDLASNSDLNQMQPSDFSYYIIDDIALNNKSNALLITHTKFESYIDGMRNGLQLIKPILFDNHSAGLTQNSKKDLNNFIKYLKTHIDLQIQIEGHTNMMIEEVDADDLSNDRAKTVALYLEENGIEESRIQYRGFGNHITVIGSNNKKITDQRMNDRVEIKLR